MHGDDEAQNAQAEFESFNRNVKIEQNVNEPTQVCVTSLTKNPSLVVKPVRERLSEIKLPLSSFETLYDGAQVDFQGESHTQQDVNKPKPKPKKALQQDCIGQSSYENIYDGAECDTITVQDIKDVRWSAPVREEDSSDAAFDEKLWMLNQKIEGHWTEIGDLLQRNEEIDRNLPQGTLCEV